MALFARIQSGAVVELFTPPAGITPATMFHPSLVWMDCTATSSVVPGWTCAAGVFAAPAVVVVPYPSTTAALAFLERFTTAEANAIQAAALASPTTPSSLALHPYLMEFGAATVVDLTSALAIGGLGALVSAGLLASAGQTAILIPWPTASTDEPSTSLTDLAVN